MLGKNTGTNKINTKKSIMCRDQCGSVGWASSCKAKSCWFNSWSRRMPGLWARAPVGGMQEATNGCFLCMSMCLSLFLSLSSPL